jgi:hypothetical protein
LLTSLLGVSHTVTAGPQLIYDFAGALVVVCRLLMGKASNCRWGENTGLSCLLSVTYEIFRLGRVLWITGRGRGARF